MCSIFSYIFLVDLVPFIFFLVLFDCLFSFFSSSLNYSVDGILITKQMNWNDRKFTRAQKSDFTDFREFWCKQQQQKKTHWISIRFYQQQKEKCAMKRIQHCINRWMHHGCTHCMGLHIKIKYIDVSFLYFHSFYFILMFFSHVLVKKTFSSLKWYE